MLTVVMTAIIAIMASSAANAQIGRLGTGNGLGTRLGGRAAQPQPEDLAPAATPTTPASAAATPGVTRPVQNPTSTTGATAATAPTATAASGAQQEKAPITKSDGSEFVIPADATPEQLTAQAASLLATDIAFESEKEYNAWVQKMLQTVGKIADRILTLKPDDKYFVEAISLKGQVLCYQASLDSSVLPKLKQYADALAKNTRVQGLEDGRNATLAFTGVYLQAVVADVAERQGTARELTAAMSQVDAFVKEHPETSDMCVDLVFPVALVAANLKDPTLVDKIWNPIRKTLTDAGTPEAQNALLMLNGTIRFSQLQGATFEWKGCDLDGKPFDETKVKGRVVLVDFWASWAEQSLETHKQLLELYNKYHSQGFEIVSYCLDPQLEDTQKYLKTNKLPWIILSDRATVDAKATSLAGYYGITEIPTMILVGGDGKVASTDISMERSKASLPKTPPARPARPVRLARPAPPRQERRPRRRFREPRRNRPSRPSLPERSPDRRRDERRPPEFCRDADPSRAILLRVCQAQTSSAARWRRF